CPTARHPSDRATPATASRSSTATVRPSAASRAAIPAPIPLPAPVTTATRGSMRVMSLPTPTSLVMVASAGLDGGQSGNATAEQRLPAQRLVHRVRGLGHVQLDPQVVVLDVVRRLDVGVHGLLLVLRRRRGLDQLVELLEADLRVRAVTGEEGLQAQGRVPDEVVGEDRQVGLRGTVRLEGDPLLIGDD